MFKLLYKYMIFPLLISFFPPKLCETFFVNSE